MRILVAEDDRGLQEVLVLGLRDAGYQVDAVDRGDDAIDQLRWYEYDVAVIDWRMPGAEGIDVVAWARKHDRPTALLMLTARDTPADRIRGACKYSPEGGAVDVTVAASGGRARLAVEDAGPGIPEAERELIFDRFHRATDKESGAGLGLAIADAIVRATGGRWQVAASPAGGARMSVSWPVAGGGSHRTGRSA